MHLISQGRGRTRISSSGLLFPLCPRPFLCKFFYRTLPRGERCLEATLGGGRCFKNWTYAARMWTILNQRAAKTKAGPGSTLKDSRRSFKWVEMMCVWCRQSHASPLTGCDGLTTLALIQGDTQPSNLLSAQFQWTMEFRARRYTTLLSALRLAARLMRLRLPTGEPNGVKTKVLLQTNNLSLHYHTERCWLLANTPALPRKCTCIGTRFLKGYADCGGCC